MAQTARKVVADLKEETAVQTSIIALVAEKPSIVLLDEKKLNEYVAALRIELDADPATIDTAKGRDTIKAKAAGVARKKTAIDNARKGLTEEWRKKTATVNAVGKIVVEKLDALRDEVRAPLTAWEEGEEARKAEAQAIIDDMMSASIIREGDTVADLQERLDRIRGRNLSDEMFGPRIEMVTDLRDSTVQALQDGIARLEQAEKDRAELQRLRDEAEQRKRDDAARAEAEAAAREEAARAENEAAARAKAQAEEAARIEQAKQEAAEAAIQAEREAATKREREAEEARLAAIDEANRRAEEAAAEARRAAQAEIDEANARAAQAAAEAESERRRVAAAEQARRDEEARIAAEQAAREADAAHRKEVMDRATAVLSDFADINTVQAKAIIAAIADGNVPAVSIAF
jgi:colicin import membrane protein